MKVVNKTIQVTSLTISFEGEEIKDLVPVLKFVIDHGGTTVSQRKLVIDLLSNFQQVTGA